MAVGTNQIRQHADALQCVGDYCDRLAAGGCVRLGQLVDGFQNLQHIITVFDVNHIPAKGLQFLIQCAQTHDGVSGTAYLILVFVNNQNQIA